VRLGVVGLGQGTSPRFFDLGGGAVDPIFSYRWSRDGSLLVDTSDLYVKRRRILVVEPGAGTAREIYREEEEENVTAYWQAEWAPDGRAIYFLSDRDEDYHLYRLPLEGGTPSRITSGGFAVSQFAVTSRALIFVANSPRAEDRQIFRVGLEGGESVRVSRESGTHTPVVSPDGRFAASLFSSDRMPPELLLTSLRDGPETRVTRSPLPEFDKLAWVSPEYVSFESHVDGARIHGRLQVPARLDRTKRHPAIVGSIYSNTVRNQWGGRNAHPLWGLERHLLETGYILFNIDIRGSWGRGKAFRRGIGKNYGGIDVEDVESGVRYLSRLPFVDGERIGIWGSSYGGLLTCMSLFTKPGLFRAGVAGAPATNVFHATTGEMRVMMAPQDERAAYEAASTYTRAEGLEDPLLLIHGMRDRTVLYQDSVFLVDRLMRLGKDVDFVSLPDAGHGWDFEELHQTRFAFRKLVDFFDRHLKE
jgi:dipeptidyl-peptidase-4